MLAATLLEVHRSPRRAECDDRAFMLTAVGIPYRIDFDGWEFVLLVDESHYTAARTHLQRYDIESRPPPPAPPPKQLNPYAWLGCLAYVLVLLGVGYAVAGGWWRLDAFDLGAVDAARVKAGEWWRAWTALTLHADAPHLIANLGAGVWFGYLASRQLGPGTAWLLTVLAAGVANLVECYIGPSTHRSVGASTAVFTVLGLLSAYTWRIRYELPQRWALRWGPLIAGAVLLALLGAGGPSVVDSVTEGVRDPNGGSSRVDVVAHVAGFVAGVVVGGIAATSVMRRRIERVSQVWAGVGAVAVLGAAWGFALAS